MNQRSINGTPTQASLHCCPFCQAKQRLRLRLTAFAAVRFANAAEAAAKRQAWGKKATIHDFLA